MLRNIVLDSDTFAGRIFDWSIIGLIAYSAIAISLETLPNLPAGTRQFLHYSDVVVTLIFTVEYVLRIVVAPRKTAYLFSFHGIVDLLAILPFYLSIGQVDLRVVRVFRLFRIFRLLKLAKFSQAMDRFGRALRITLEESLLFIFTAVLLIYLSSMGIWYFEHVKQPEKFSSVFASFGWVIGTLTAGGFVDIFPMTIGGRVLMLVMLVCGIGIIAVPAGLMGTALTRAHEDQQTETRKTDASA